MNHVRADVCVVGAGYAGLSAARALARAGRDVVVLEARDRVGGRIWTVERDGERVDIGGAWLGPTQDVVYALAREYGVATHPTYDSGETVLAMGNDVRRFRGHYPDWNLTYDIDTTIAEIHDAFAQRSRQAIGSPR